MITDTFAVRYESWPKITNAVDNNFISNMS